MALRPRLAAHRAGLRHLGGRLAALRQRLAPGSVSSAAQRSAAAITGPGVLDVESAPRVARHWTRGVDAETKRAARDRENRDCRAGLRNPRLAVAEFPQIRAVMSGVAEVLRGARARDPSLQGLSGARGRTPTRGPPSEEAIAAVRLEVYRHLRLEPTLGEARHPRTEWRAGLIGHLLAATQDPDTVLSAWLLHGAPAGYTRPVPPGPWFPAADPDVAEAESELLTAGRNHPSFYETYGEDIAPGLRLACEAAEGGFGMIYPSRAAAEEAVGPTHPAPLGNVRKARPGGMGWKDRLILDLKSNKANLLVVLRERVVLPRGVDHALDLAHLRAKHRRVKSLVLDYKDAFHWIPLHPDEVGFCCADLGPAGFIVFFGMGFGGRAFPTVFGRVISFVARTTQGLFLEDEARLQVYVDDPVLSAGGSEEEVEATFDVAILWWLVLGSRLSWAKGVAASGSHVWIGIRFLVDADGAAIMEVTEEYAAGLRVSLRPLAATSGITPIREARKAVGRAQRVAQVVPEAQPFASALWAALTEASRDAGHCRHGHVANVRFAHSAVWFLRLLDGAVLPLQRRVYPQAHRPVVPGPMEISYDASPWGWGALRRTNGIPTSWAAGLWDETIVERFRAVVGDPAFQTLWEHVAELYALILWADEAEGAPFALQGGNLGALNNFARLRGRGALLQVTREMAWRKAARRWTAVVSHRPSECNDIADALSRLGAPEAKPMPPVLAEVPQAHLPAEEEIWQTWSGAPERGTGPAAGRRRKRKRGGANLRRFESTA